MHNTRVCTYIIMHSTLASMHTVWIDAGTCPHQVRVILLVLGTQKEDNKYLKSFVPKSKPRDITRV